MHASPAPGGVRCGGFGGWWLPRAWLAWVGVAPGAAVVPLVAPLRLAVPPLVVFSGAATSVGAAGCRVLVRAVSAAVAALSWAAMATR